MPAPSFNNRFLTQLGIIPISLIVGAVILITAAASIPITYIINQSSQDTRSIASGESCDWCAGADQCYASTGRAPLTGPLDICGGLPCCMGYTPPSGSGETGGGGDGRGGNTCNVGDRKPCGADGCAEHRQRICQAGSPNYWGPCVNSTSCGYTGGGAGATCSLDSHCNQSQGLKCINNKCQLTQTATPKETDKDCSNDSECSSGYCDPIAGTCQTKPKNAGEACTQDSECNRAKGYKCVNNKCQIPKPTDQDNIKTNLATCDKSCPDPDGCICSNQSCSVVSGQSIPENWTCGTPKTEQEITLSDGKKSKLYTCSAECRDSDGCTCPNNCEKKETGPYDSCHNKGTDGTPGSLYDCLTVCYDEDGCHCNVKKDECQISLQSVVPYQKACGLPTPTPPSDTKEINAVCERDDECATGYCEETLLCRPEEERPCREDTILCTEEGGNSYRKCITAYKNYWSEKISTCPSGTICSNNKCVTPDPAPRQSSEVVYFMDVTTPDESGETTTTDKTAQCTADGQIKNASDECCSGSTYIDSSGKTRCGQSSQQIPIRMQTTWQKITNNPIVKNIISFWKRLTEKDTAQTPPYQPPLITDTPAPERVPTPPPDVSTPIPGYTPEPQTAPTSPAHQFTLFSTEISPSNMLDYCLSRNMTRSLVVVPVPSCTDGFANYPIDLNSICHELTSNPNSTAVPFDNSRYFCSN